MIVVIAQRTMMDRAVNSRLAIVEMDVARGKMTARAR
jgi:hypothetical protein